MSRWCGPRSLLAVLVASYLAGAALPARAQEGANPPPKIYRWIDENGIAHYTTDPSRIPGSLRYKIPDAAPAPLPPAASETPPSGAPAPAAAAPPATAPSAPAASEARTAPPAAARTGPDAWASSDRGKAPARTLTTEPFSEGSAEGSAAATPPSTAAAPAPGSAAKPQAAVPPGSQGQTTLDDLDYRIAALQADIQADEKLIASRLGNAQGGGPLAAGDDPKFREAALRLPERLKELKKLQEERAKLVQPGSGS